MRRRLVLVVAGMATASLVVLGVAASAASLDVDGGTLQAFTLPVQIDTPVMPLTASVDIQPDSIQTASQGEDVTAYIELPEGVDVAEIDVATVALCGAGGCVSADASPTAVGDHDGDGVPDRMVKFGRHLVIALVADVQAPAEVTFVVSGLVGGTPFAGADTVRVIGPEEDPEASASAAPEPPASAAPEPPTSAAPEPPVSPEPEPPTSPEPEASASPEPSVSPQQPASPAG